LHSVSGRRHVAALFALAAFGNGVAWGQNPSSTPSASNPVNPAPVVPAAPSVSGAETAPTAPSPAESGSATSAAPPGSVAPAPLPQPLPPPPPAAAPAAATAAPASAIAIDGRGALAPVDAAPAERDPTPAASAPQDAGGTAQPVAPTVIVTPANGVATSESAQSPNVEQPQGAASPVVGEADFGSFEYALVVDANYAVSSSHRNALAPAHRTFVWAGADGGVSNGFGLEWFGGDLAYRYKTLSVHTNLRFGDGARRFLSERTTGTNLVPLAEAYLSWAPLKQLTLDIGQFRSSIGSESYDSFRNLNYSQGALFGLLQPWWHTGLRVRADLGETLSLEGLVANGANTTFDEDDAPSGGLRVSVRPIETFSLVLGGYRTFDTGKDTSGYDTVGDLVARLQLGALQLMATAMVNRVSEDPVPFSNSTTEGDLRAQPRGGVLWGAGGAAVYRVHAAVQIAARYEYVSDREGLQLGGGLDAARLQTGTLTLDVTPFKDISGFSIRWDNRVEWSDRALFVNTVEEPSRRWFGSTLAFVFHTDPR
jgi:Putative beta-barrel porin-2, OmpL-like. bbp2